MRLIFGLLLASFAGSAASAQIEILDGKTTASLRGIDAVSPQVAWASGSGGTVLLTTDGGKNWKHCAVPTGGEKLDFRGVQGFDASSAIVMSSGKGDLSKLYKTTDACQTWRLVFTNPDEDGFFDSIVARSGRGFVIGDPVDGHFVIFASQDGGFESWQSFGHPAHQGFRDVYVDARPLGDESLFAASNSAMEGDLLSDIEFVTGGPHGPMFHGNIWRMQGPGNPTELEWTKRLPMAEGSSAGAFSLAGYGEQTFRHTRRYVVVGGDYKLPDDAIGTSAYSKDGGQHWKTSKSSPKGYRSAVTYDGISKVFVAVGPGGVDISKDDGKTWTQLKPSASDAPDADKNWNAISLPFVVGSKGKIGKLNAKF